MLPKIRVANRELCEADDLMPRFSPQMTHVCVSKTHFVRAQKLAKEGNRTVFNKGDVNLRWQDGDDEGAQIMEQGPMCVIYSSSLLLDPDATNALAVDDDLEKIVPFRCRLAPSQEISIIDITTLQLWHWFCSKNDNMALVLVQK